MMPERGWQFRVSDIVIQAAKDYDHVGNPGAWRGGMRYAEDIREAIGGVTIEVRQDDWIPAFGAFAAGSIEATGTAHVVLNVGAILAVVEEGDMEPADVPYMVAETIMHEVIHALEEWAGVEFSEDRVEELLDRYRNARPDSGGTE